MIKLEKYSEVYLASSWKWLNDPEIKFLTRTPTFTKAEQRQWFDGLTSKTCYYIWGVSFNSIPIGVFGIKNVDNISKTGEYWGYIGEKQYWGRGLGKEIMNRILCFASNDLKLNSVYLKVIVENINAVKLYKKVGFCETSNDGITLIMTKIF